MKDKGAKSRRSSALLPRHGREDVMGELGAYHSDRLAALGILAAGIAHELNQPLNTIRVVTDGFLFGRTEGWPLDPEELYEGLEMISRQVARMDQVIRNIRDFAREECDKKGEGAQVNEAIENVFSIIGRQIEAHGIRVERNLDPDLPPLDAPLGAIEQVVMNLIVNARQALDAVSCDHKVLSVSTSRQGRDIMIEVCDNGGGIPSELMEKIFDPFFTTKAAGNGTGLGLSICRSIVNKFNGRIEASNNDKGGATFTVLVPAGERP